MSVQAPAALAARMQMARVACERSMARVGRKVIEVSPVGSGTARSAFGRPYGFIGITYLYEQESS